MFLFRISFPTFKLLILIMMIKFNLTKIRAANSLADRGEDAPGSYHKFFGGFTASLTGGVLAAGGLLWTS